MTTTTTMQQNEKMKWATQFLFHFKHVYKASKCNYRWGRFKMHFVALNSAMKQNIHSQLMKRACLLMKINDDDDDVAFSCIWCQTCKVFRRFFKHNDKESNRIAAYDQHTVNKSHDSDKSHAKRNLQSRVSLDMTNRTELLLRFRLLLHAVADFVYYNYQHSLSQWSDQAIESDSFFRFDIVMHLFRFLGRKFVQESNIFSPWTRATKLESSRNTVRKKLNERNENNVDHRMSDLLEKKLRTLSEMIVVHCCTLWIHLI